MYKSILLPVDLNQESSWKVALPKAIEMASGNSAKLHILTVIPDFGMSMVASYFPADYAKGAVAETKKVMADFISAQVPDGVQVSTYVRHGTIYKEIIQSADALECDLIVLASHRPETSDYLLGPNAARVVRHAKQSVFVIRNS